MFKKIAIALVGVGIIAYTGYLLITPQTAAEIVSSSDTEDIIFELNEAEVETVHPQSLYEKIKISGTLKPVQATTIRSKTSGTVETVNFKVGDEVKEGDVLVTLDQHDQINMLAQSESNIRTAKERLHAATEALVRAQSLHDKGYNSAAALDNARAEKIAAESALEVNKTQLTLAQKSLKDTTLVAPHDGVISSRFVEPAETINNNADLLSIVDITKLEIAVEVPTRSIANITIGDGVKLITDVSDAALSGEVIRISPSASESSRSVTVFLQVQNTDMKAWPGTFATGEIITKSAENVIAVPEDAIVIEDDMTFALKVVDGKIVKVEVDVAESWPKDKKIIIRQGLHVDDIILVRPLRGLSVGDGVKLIKV